MRGSTKAALFAELHDVAPPPSSRAKRVVALPERSSDFWHGAPLGSAAVAAEATTRKARKRALPAFPFWRGSEPLEAALARIDEFAVAAALAILSDPGDEDRDV